MSASCSINGGTIYIDEGKPLPGLIEETVRNLREIAPTWYFTVPKGYEALLPYFRADDELRRNFFSRLKVLWFAGAALAQPVFDEMKELAIKTCGERILFLTGLGSTETAPFAMARMWESSNSTNMGLPAPACELKLVPLRRQARSARARAEHHAGLLAPARADREGVRRGRLLPLGDALKFEDPANPGQGFLFDGRIAEDFKLATGTWVSVGPLRAQADRALRALCARRRDRRRRPRRVGIADLPRSRRLPHASPRDLPPDAPLPDVLEHRNVLAEIRGAARELRQARDRQLQPRLPRAPAGRAALARCRRDHRQGLDQPARGAAPSRRAGRRALRRSALAARHRARRQSPGDRHDRASAHLFTDAWLLDGVRTPFADYNGALADVSPTDLGIKAAREVFARAGVDAADIGTVDHRQHGAGELRRLRAAAPYRALFRRADRGAGASWCSASAAPASRCIMQAADAVSLGRARSGALRRHRIDEPQPDRRLYPPQRLPHGAGRVQGFPLGGAARPGRQRATWATPRRTSRASTRSPAPEVDAFAARSFERAVAAQTAGFLAGEIAPVTNETFELDGLRAARHQAARATKELDRRHPYPPLAARGAGKDPPGLRRRADRRQFLGHRRWRGGGAGRLVGLRRRSTARRRSPASSRARSVGVPPEIMGIGPVPAIKAVLERAGLTLADIDRFEINEAFGAQVLACARELGLDEDKLNVNGGAIAIGHPLGATGVRLAITLARELKRSGTALRHRLGLHRRRPGHRAADREPRGCNCTEELTMDITGHAAIVTGGASGLGAATARDAGAGRRQGRLPRRQSRRRAGGRATKIGGIAINCDVTDADERGRGARRGARQARRRRAS